MKSLLFFLIVLLAGSSCRHGSSESTTTDTQLVDSLKKVSYTHDAIQADTTLFAKPEQVGMLDDNLLSESSGIAPSKQNPGYLWTEEDSGNPSEIQLINKKGDVVGQYTLKGIDNRDWEDITVGPGPIPGKSYVYVAEIGDNGKRHPVKIIYRFLEPTLKPGKQPVRDTITAIDAIRLQLPDGPKNAEAILLDPGTLDVYLLSKENQCILYKASYPQSLTRITLMQRLLVLPFGNVTSAAMSPNGQEILLRSYHQLVYFSRKTGESVTDAFKRQPCSLPLAEEPQGEAVGWAADGSGYFTTSERPFLFAQPLYFYRRN